MNIVISVIVPVYKGTEYLNMRLEQAENAANKINVPMEIIFVNDDPEKPLPEGMSASGIEVLALQTDKNYGIQGARIKGLALARGEFVHFLDQDDEVFPEFYKSQYEQIGDADLVFCRCYNGKRLIYNKDRVFETAFTKEHMANRCPMFSPGQALIRKCAIPELWKREILQNQGSDDYMLWLLMLAEKVEVVANQDILFRHVLTGNNFSADILKMYASDKEMVEVLLKYKVFDEEYAEQISVLPQKYLNRRYQPQRKKEIVLAVLEKILRADAQGISIAKYLEDRKCYKVAIFGASIMGERIYDLLKESAIDVKFFIDKNALYIEEEIPVVELESSSWDIDAIIISNIENENYIEDDIRKYIDVPIYRIRTVADEIERM